MMSCLKFAILAAMACSGTCFKNAKRPIQQIASYNSGLTGLTKLSKFSLNIFKNSPPKESLVVPTLTREGNVSSTRDSVSAIGVIGISFIFCFLLSQQSSTLTQISAAQVELSATQAQQSSTLTRISAALVEMSATQAQLSATQSQQSAMLAKNEMVVESISKDVNGFIYALGGFTVLSAGGASVVTILSFLKEETKAKNDDTKI